MRIMFSYVINVYIIIKQKKDEYNIIFLCIYY